MHHYSIFVNNSYLDIYRFRYEPVDSNMYFIPVGDSGFVFDPNVSEELLLLFSQYGTKKVQIVLTHEHYDHTTGVEWLQNLLDAPVFCQQYCANDIASDKGNNPNFVALVLKTLDITDGLHRYDKFMASYKPYLLNADETFLTQGTVAIRNVIFECISTPGHSPGSACYLLNNKYVFTGDSLIKDTPTILRFKTSNKVEFEQKTRPFLRSLEKNMLVFPGHGDPFNICEAKYL